MPQGAGEATRGLCQVGSRETLAQKIGSSRLKNIIKMIFYLEVENTVIGYRWSIWSFKINWESKRVQYGLMMKTCIIKGGGLPLAPIHLVSPPSTPRMPWEVSLNKSCSSRWVWCLNLMLKTPEVNTGQWQGGQRIPHWQRHHGRQHLQPRSL